MLDLEVTSDDYVDGNPALHPGISVEVFLRGANLHRVTHYFILREVVRLFHGESDRVLYVYRHADPRKFFVALRDEDSAQRLHGREHMSCEPGLYLIFRDVRTRLIHGTLRFVPLSMKDSAFERVFAPYAKPGTLSFGRGHVYQGDTRTFRYESIGKEDEIPYYLRFKINGETHKIGIVLPGRVPACAECGQTSHPFFRCPLRSLAARSFRAQPRQQGQRRFVVPQANNSDSSPPTSPSVDEGGWKKVDKKKKKKKPKKDEQASRQRSSPPLPPSNSIPPPSPSSNLPPATTKADFNDRQAASTPSATPPPPSPPSPSPSLPPSPATPRPPAPGGHTPPFFADEPPPLSMSSSSRTLPTTPSCPRSPASQGTDNPLFSPQPIPSLNQRSSTPSPPTPPRYLSHSPPLRPLTPPLPRQEDSPFRPGRTLRRTPPSSYARALAAHPGSGSDEDKTPRRRMLLPPVVIKPRTSSKDRKRGPSPLDRRPSKTSCRSSDKTKP